MVGPHPIAQDISSVDSVRFPVNCRSAFCGAIYWSQSLVLNGGKKRSGSLCFHPFWHGEGIVGHRPTFSHLALFGLFDKHTSRLADPCKDNRRRH